MSAGLFDLANPLLLAIDDRLAPFLPPVLRVVLFAALLTWLGMLLYRASSNQHRLRALKRLVRRGERGLHDPDIAFAELLKRARRSIGLQGMVLARVFLPSLLGMVPLLFGLSAMSARFSYVLPQADDELRTWCVSPAADAGRIRVNGLDPGPDCVAVPWRHGPGAELALDGQPVAHALGSGQSAVLHRRLWWNVLLDNPAGHLPDSAGDLVITVGHPEQEMHGVGPGWLRHWLLPFLATSIVLGFWWRWRWRLV